MPFFRRRRGQSSSDTVQVEATVAFYDGPEPIEVKGEASYQSALAATVGEKTEEGHNRKVYAALVRDPENSYDRNAIQVYALDSSRVGRLVGFVNRVDAAWLAPIIDQKNAEGEQVGMMAQVVGGWDRGNGDEGHYGIWLYYDPEDFGGHETGVVRPR